MSKASQDAMEKLHEALANQLTELCKTQKVTDANGEEVKVPPSASILNVARQFLKDNGIEGAGTPTSPQGNLAAALAALEEAEGAEAQ